MSMNNCGSKCVVCVHVQDGKVTEITQDKDERCPDGVPFVACVRGLNYHKTFLGDDRLRYPMKRVGERGEGKFERISWDEALDTITSEYKRIRASYGPASTHVMYSTGNEGINRGNAWMKRLLSIDGGHLGYYNNYSTGCIDPVTKLVYGTTQTGHTQEDWLNSELIILWGHNPQETKFDQTMHYLKAAKAKGIPIVVVDPRKSDTVNALGAEWIPIKPTTDAAMMDAMAYVIVSEGLQDQEFIDRCCIGFTREHMPEGVPENECYFDYLNGIQDGIAKTPEWAEPICGVPAETIRDLALRYGRAKAAALVQGYGAQRHINGEQAARGGIALACLTGNVGKSGGWASGSANAPRHVEFEIPRPMNPVQERFPAFAWSEVVERGAEMTAYDGIISADEYDENPRLASNIKMLFSLSGNMMINQHGDINHTKEILKDTSKCEFIVCNDVFMTASAKFADILLPGTSMFEMNNIMLPWKNGNFLGSTTKVIEPFYECRTDYDWISEFAERLGLRDAFTEGRTELEWLEFIYNKMRDFESELPEFSVFRENGIYRYEEPADAEVAFVNECKDPEKYPWPTESGKIEIFSRSIYAKGQNQYGEKLPAGPRYVAGEEGPEDAELTSKYPLQLVGWHTKRRAHSVHDNNLDLHKVDPQMLWINPIDAEVRGIEDGDEVLISNDRGKIRIGAKVTDRIAAGVTALSQGAWYNPDENGVDRGGCINVLTSHRRTLYTQGNPQHTILVEVERV